MLPVCVCLQRPAARAGALPVRCAMRAGGAPDRGQVTAAMPAGRRLPAAPTRHCNQRGAANTGPTGSCSACYCG
ncbi:hypothetical protein CBM2637_B20077 [Cupriavidus taiwanensis]|nr:hypothetical protein CBM2637_B20077 [Cupriavidus taiwanensis]